MSPAASIAPKSFQKEVEMWSGLFMEDYDPAALCNSLKCSVFATYITVSTAISQCAVCKVVELYAFNGFLVFFS